MKPIPRRVMSWFFALLFCGPALASAAELQEIARSANQWTGVAVSREGRIFVNFPRWSETVPISVAEITIYGQLIPFPNEKWNQWEPGQSPAEHWVCVQSVYIDDENHLWVLDPANPRFAGVIDGGPKLIRFDIRTGAAVEEIRFDDDAVPADAYLNDVRVDTKSRTAYVTDSGAGAILVVNLETGGVRRLLDEHPATHAEDIELTIGGAPWRRPDGTAPQVHADGLALTPDRAHLYFQALSGRTLYRVPTADLRDETLSDAALAGQVELVDRTGAADGIMFDREGHLYLSHIEDDAVRRYTPAGALEMVVQDPRLRWPDSFARGPDGRMVVTTSQIHLGPDPETPYQMFRIRPESP
jgi:sugar lactone lactonase YvrE